MPSGWGAVAAGWKLLSPEVLDGPFTSRMSSEPSTRGRRVVLPHILPDHRPAVLRSHAEDALDDLRAQEIARIIAAHDDVLLCATRIVDAALVEVRRSGNMKLDHSPVLRASLLVALEADGSQRLDQSFAVAQGARIGEERLVSRIGELKSTFTLPAVTHAIEERLATARAAHLERPSDDELIREFERELLRFLDAVRFDARRRPAYADEATAWRAWDRLVELDLAHGMVSESILGQVATSRVISNHLVLEGAVLASGRGTEEVPPLERPLYDRLWSVLRGAAGREWEKDLPPLEDLIEVEIRCMSSPFGLATAQTRTALALGFVVCALAGPEQTHTRGHRLGPETALPRGARFAMDKLDELAILSRPRTHARSVAGDRTDEQAQGMTVGRTRELLGYEIQDILCDPLPHVLPKLWTALHGLEFRPDIAKDPLQLWARVAGEIVSFVQDLKSRYNAQTLQGARTHGVPLAAVAVVAHHIADVSGPDAVSSLFAAIHAGRAHDGSLETPRRVWDTHRRTILRGATAQRVSTPDGGLRIPTAHDCATFTALLRYLDTSALEG